jgi:hypothetical protein
LRHVERHASRVDRLQQRAGLDEQDAAHP